jgi:hypothetical protein
MQKWQAYCLGSEGYQVRKNNEGVPAAKIKEDLKARLTPIVERMGGSFEEQKANSELIVSSVNACISINPNNPQVVAEAIGDMHKALKSLVEKVEQLSLWDKTDQSYYKAKQALAKIEGR